MNHSLIQLGYLSRSNKTLTERSIKKSKALENLNDKLLGILNDTGLSASHLTSLLSKITTPEHTSQITLVRDPSSIRVNHLLINKTIPVTL